MSSSRVPAASPSASSAARRSAGSLAENLLIIGHIPLGLWMAFMPVVATTHAWFVGLLGIYTALQGQARKIGFFVVYVTSSEVLWRMSGAEVNWQYAKYLVLLSCIIGLIRTGAFRPPLSVAVYFILLLPAAWLTASVLPWSESRTLISANFAGPLALAVAIWFFGTRVHFTREGFMQLSRLVIAPVAGIMAIALWGTLTSDIYFGRSSLAVTSGGFGANQVSAVLGLGVLFGVFVLVLENRRSAGRILIWLLVGMFALQGALTFSRTGLALATLGLIAFLPVVLRRGGRRPLVYVILGVSAIVVIGVAVPQLNQLTEGAFAERYTDPDLTGRDDIALTDLKMWRDNPVVGVGMGRSPDMRYRYDYKPSLPHTEYTRLLAEHGMLGVAALLCMGWFFLMPLSRTGDPPVFHVRLALLIWSAAFLAVSAFRLVVPAILIGLCWSSLEFGASSPEASSETGA